MLADAKRQLHGPWAVSGTGGPGDPMRWLAVVAGIVTAGSLLSHSLDGAALMVLFLTGLIAADGG